MNKNSKIVSNKKEEHGEEFHFEILNHLGILSANSSGWKKELNVVKWNDANPKVDIREWDAEHEKMSRGASLNMREAEKLRDLLLEYDLSSILPQ